MQHLFEVSIERALGNKMGSNPISQATEEPQPNKISPNNQTSFILDLFNILRQSFQPLPYQPSLIEQYAKEVLAERKERSKKQSTTQAPQ